MKASTDRSPTPSSARAACQFGCTFWSASPTGRDQVVRGCPAIATGSHSAPATTGEILRRAGPRRGCPPTVHQGIERGGSHESKLLTHDGDTAHHVGQFLTCCPTSSLTEAAIRSGREFFRWSIFQTEANALGDVAGGFDVIAFHIDDPDRHIHSALCDLANLFDFGELAAGHLKMQFIDRQ